MTTAHDHAIRITLLGPPAVTVDGVRARLSRKTLALLGYLALQDAPHQRSHLAGLLFSEANDPLGALRWHLSRIRKMVSASLLQEQDGRVQFADDAAWLDVRAFEAAGATPSAQADCLKLYQGELLAGITLADAPEFEVWLSGERARLQRMVEQALEGLLAQATERHAWAEAIGHALALLASDPLREDVHGQLMQLYAANGQTREALRQFEQAARILREELAVEPSPFLHALRDEIAAQRQVIPVTTGATPSQGGAFVVPPAPPLVERKEALAALAQGLASARRTGTYTLFLHAEAGGGKSSTVQWFAGEQADCRFLIGNCYESTETVAYRPWSDLLQRWMNALPAGTWQGLSGLQQQHLRRLLPGLPGLGNPVREPAADGQESLYTAVTDLLLGTEQRPLILFLDDLQWADQASLQLLLSLAQPAGATDRPALFLVGAYRTEEAADNPALLTLLHDLRRLADFTEIALPPLSADAVEELMARLWPDLPPGFRAPHLRDSLLAQTGGNPLYMTELLEELATADTLPTAVPVPRSLQDLIDRRLRQLPGAAVQVVETLAILDEPTQFETLQAVSGRSDAETEEAVETGLARRFLQLRTDRSPLVIDFRHELMRAGVLARMSELRRQRLHQRAAENLSRQGAQAARLAFHWGQAGRQDEEARAAVQAGIEAAAGFANMEAIRFFERALTLELDAIQRLDVLVRLGSLYEKTGRPAEAEQIARQQVALAASLGDMATLADGRVALSRLLRMKGAYDGAIEQLEQARTSFIQAEDNAGLAQVYNSLGAIYWSQLAYDQALAAFEEQLALSEMAEDLPAVCSVLSNLGVVSFEMGSVRQALDYYTRSLDLAIRLEDRMRQNLAVSNFAIFYAYMGEFETALAAYTLQIRQALDLSNRLSLGVALGNLIDLFGEQGHHEKALACGQRGIQIMRVLEMPMYLCEYLFNQAQVLFESGEPQAAARLNDEALSVATKIQREDIVCRSRLLALRLVSPDLSLDSLRGKLAALAEQYTDPVLLAEIGYEQWRLLPDQDDLRQRTGQAYARLHEQAPFASYRQRYQALTGLALDAPPLPDPPPLLRTPTAPLGALLDEIDGELAALS